MADIREQINPKIAGTTKALLQRYCQEHHATQGDVVEAALVAFFQPVADTLHPDSVQSHLQGLTALLQGVATKQEALEQGVAALMPLLTAIVERLAPPPPAPDPPPAVADYTALYGPLQGVGAGETVAAEDGAVAPEAGAPDTAGAERRGWFFSRRPA
jgi:hypothetical protein